MQFLQVGEQTDMAALSVRDDRSSPDAFVAFPLRYRDLQELPLSIADGRSQAEVLQECEALQTCIKEPGMIVRYRHLH
jgi:hypothetical protein